MLSPHIVTFAATTMKRKASIPTLTMGESAVGFKCHTHRWVSATDWFQVSPALVINIGYKSILEV